jgi:lysophospholipase L1-like esterase
VTNTVRRRLLAAVTVLAAGAATLVGAASNSQAGEVHRPHWVGTWATALTQASSGNAGGSLTGFTNESIRMIVRTSVAGNRVRVRLSNAFGTQAFTIGHATVALPAAHASADLQPGSIHDLTFQGSTSTTVFKGADVLSDPVNMDLPALTELAVTVFFPTATGPATWHNTARETSYVYTGDRASDPSGATPEITRNAFYFVAGVDVVSRHADGSVVVLGDSISDGNGSTLNANTRWPDFLAARFEGTHRGDDVGVLNEGLAGNRVTHDGSEVGFFTLGLSGLARLDPDVYGQTAVQSVIVELGVNDINFTTDPADRIIAGLKQLAAQAHEKDLKILVCTIGPFEGFTGTPTWDPTKEAIRVQVNDYIRGQHDFDAVVDLDKVLRDPAAPTKVRADLDSGDHIHPNDAGAKAIADAVHLSDL